MIWRRFQILGNTSLARLHNIIQIAYSWDDEYLHQFHIYGQDYGIQYAGGPSFANDANKVFLNNFDFDIGNKFTYEYNFFEHYLIDIHIENIKDTTLQTLTYCIAGNGMFGVNKYDEVEPTLNLLKKLINTNEATTIDDILPLVDSLNVVRFNKHRINKYLQT